MKHFIRISLISLGLIGVLSWSGSALASPYGEGSYGECQYSQDCPQPTDSGSGGSTKKTTTATGETNEEIILLNDYPEYFSEAGKDLALEQGKIVYVDITKDGKTERHSATIKEVGSDYVIVLLDPGSTEVRIDLNDIKKFDLSGDGNDDFQIKLVSITDGKATFNFRALSAEVEPTPVTTSTPTDSEPDEGNTVLVLGLSGLALLAALFIFFLLWKRRKDRKEDKNITTNTK